ncbi:hypothetical protein ACFU1R_05955 [Priestia megaterium]|uniref:DUF5983 family protein n=1 Tax=Priestia megaterium TaxID=1404 RepID=UPI00366BF821
MEINQMLSLSTAHVTKDASEWLDGQAKLTKDNKMDLITYPKGGYGWFIPLYDEMFDEGKIIPDSVLFIIGYAMGKGCQWIMFDHEIEPIDELPKYVW